MPGLAHGLRTGRPKIIGIGGLSRFSEGVDLPAGRRRGRHRPALACAAPLTAYKAATRT
jgi:hypothetical protein